VNLVISIVLVQKIGLVGIYIGTIVSGLIANFTKPFIIYKVCFDKKAGAYFMESVKYLIVLAVILSILTALKGVIMQTVTPGSFTAMFVICCVVFNALFLLVFGRTEEFGYIWEILRKKCKKQ
ncbi:MAG: polysaccharide biosynthesis protein, partial [Lachnospiraceae bacterium]|nr:polysaccharide biosynthesis protein [Lachnospiraceae bacterium]